VAVAFLWGFTSEDNTLLYRGGFLILALAVAVVIAAVVQPKAGPIGRLLSLPPLRALGLISYGVYLWHWPIYLMLTPARTGLTSWDGYQLFVVRVLATLAIATASYHLLEMPIRRGAFRHRKVAWTFAPSGAMALAVIVVLVTRGAVSPSAALSAEPMPPINKTANPQPIRVMVYGDSVGLSLEPGLEKVGQKDWNLSVWSRAGLGCGFLPVDKSLDNQWNLTKEQADRCKEWYKTWKTDVDAFKPDVVVWLFGFWDGLDHLVNGRTLVAGTPEWDAFVLDGLQKQFELLTSQGAKLALLTWPYAKPPDWALLPNGADLEQDSLRRVTELNGLYRQFAEQHPDKVTLIDLNSFICPEGKFTDIVLDGVKMREDGVHFTPESSYIVADWLAPQLADVARKGAATEPGP
jgi:hypothetical protein